MKPPLNDDLDQECWKKSMIKLQKIKQLIILKLDCKILRNETNKDVYLLEEFFLGFIKKDDGDNFRI